MQNGEDFEALQTIRAEVSQRLFEVQILVQRIYEYEENREIMTLSEICKRICQNGREDCEKLEFTIEKIKNNYKNNL